VVERLGLVKEGLRKKGRDEVLFADQRSTGRQEREEKRADLIELLRIGDRGSRIKKGPAVTGQQALPGVRGGWWAKSCSAEGLAQAARKKKPHLLVRPHASLSGARCQ